MSVIEVQTLTGLVLSWSPAKRLPAPQHTNEGTSKRANATGDPNFSLISRQCPLPHPMATSSERAALLPSWMASQPPPVVKLPTLLHHNTRGSAQDQTALMKSAQWLRQVYCSIGDSRCINNALDPSPTAAVKSDELLNYEPFQQVSNAWGDPADASASNASIPYSLAAVRDAIWRTYELSAFISTQIIAQSGYHHYHLLPFQLTPISAVHQRAQATLPWQTVVVLTLAQMPRTMPPTAARQQL